MAWQIAAIMGMQALSGAMGMGQARAEAKMQKQQEQHRNKIRRMGDAINQNNITSQEVWAQQDARVAQVQTQIQYDGAAGTALVQAALQGFSGNTSAAIQRDIAYAANLSSTNIALQAQRATQKFEAERLSSAFDAYSSLEDEWVQKPNYLGMALNTGSKMLGTSMMKKE